MNNLKGFLKLCESNSTGLDIKREDYKIIDGIPV